MKWMRARFLLWEYRRISKRLGLPRPEKVVVGRGAIGIRRAPRP